MKRRSGTGAVPIVRLQRRRPDPGISIDGEKARAAGALVEAYMLVDVNPRGLRLDPQKVKPQGENVDGRLPTFRSTHRNVGVESS